MKERYELGIFRSVLDDTHFIYNNEKELFKYENVPARSKYLLVNFWIKVYQKLFFFENNTLYVVFRI